MIIGSFSINTDPSLNLDKIRNATDHPGLTFTPVAGCGFSGGFYLNDRLPYTAADFYHTDETNDLMVLMAGFIYNGTELAALYFGKELVTDPELVSRLFIIEGPGFVGKLNGDFVIFICRPSAKQAYLFRDHAGIRPLAFLNETGSLLFASDIIGLSRACADDQVIDSEYLMGYFKYIDYRKTPYNKVLKLLPGHFLEHSGRDTKTLTGTGDPKK